MTNFSSASTAALYHKSRSEFSLHRSLFESPLPAGRRITAGFSYIQRIGKSASVDVWFPDCLRETLDKIVAGGRVPGPEAFPAQWAAVRQFELLQEAGNYKIYDLDPTQLMRTLQDITRNMRGGGYRVTVATIGSYVQADRRDELEILDRNLQDRISALIHMLYLEEQSEKINAAFDRALREERWDYQMALPHVGATLGARDLFRPSLSARRLVTVRNEPMLIPSPSFRNMAAHVAQWRDDFGVCDAASGKALARVKGNPQAGHYMAKDGVYYFAPADAWKEVLVTYRYESENGGTEMAESERKHRLSRHFFDILGHLPQKHIVHDTAVGLQLPESINENQWIYIAREGEKVGDFVRLMDNLFEPFNKLSLSELDGRGGGPEIKSTVTHMQGYGDRLRPEADQFYRSLAQFTTQ